MTLIETKYTICRYTAKVTIENLIYMIEKIDNEIL